MRPWRATVDYLGDWHGCAATWDGWVMVFARRSIEIWLRGLADQAMSYAAEVVAPRCRRLPSAA